MTTHYPNDKDPPHTHTYARTRYCNIIYLYKIYIFEPFEGKPSANIGDMDFFSSAYSPTTSPMTPKRRNSTFFLEKTCYYIGSYIIILRITYVKTTYSKESPPPLYHPPHITSNTAFPSPSTDHHNTSLNFFCVYSKKRSHHVSRLWKIRGHAQIHAHLKFIAR